MPVLESFAAKAKGVDGKERPCVEYIGPDGTGHFVKMVDNGIENGMLGLFAKHGPCCTGVWEWMMRLEVCLRSGMRMVS
jgi:hypothetical protein